MSLTIAIDGNAAARNVFLVKGTFDETSDLSVISSRGLKVFTLDLSGLTKMNSHGVGSWMKFVAASAGASVQLRGLRPFMVDYANQVAGFLPKSIVIESFYVPYATADGNREEHILFMKGVEFDDREVRVSPTAVSAQSGETLEIDVKTGSFFRFLGREIKD